MCISQLHEQLFASPSPLGQIGQQLPPSWTATDLEEKTHKCRINDFSTAQGGEHVALLQCLLYPVDRFGGMDVRLSARDRYGS